jgi:hypothetical protein
MPRIEMIHRGRLVRDGLFLNPSTNHALSAWSSNSVRYPAHAGNYEAGRCRYKNYSRYQTPVGSKEVSNFAIPGTGRKTVLQDRFRALVSFPGPKYEIKQMAISLAINWRAISRFCISELE